jgi:sugar phosphate isomerase/epimerase
MMIASRSVIASLGEANDLVDALESDHVGVIVDAYHVFWDIAVEREIARAGKSILGFHVSDWVTPDGDPLASRAMMGDGLIDLPHLRSCTDEAGYDGPIEVEVINATFRTRDGHAVLAQTIERFRSELSEG